MRHFRPSQQRLDLGDYGGNRGEYGVGRRGDGVARGSFSIFIDGLGDRSRRIKWLQFLQRLEGFVMFL